MTAGERRQESGVGGCESAGPTDLHACTKNTFFSGTEDRTQDIT